MSLPLNIRRLGRVPYEASWKAMSAFTDNRTEDTPDELWLLEHDPVFTLGQAGKMEHGRHRCAALSARLCSAAEVAVRAAGGGSGPTGWHSRAKSEEHGTRRAILVRAFS